MTTFVNILFRRIIQKAQTNCHYISWYTAKQRTYTCENVGQNSDQLLKKGHEPVWPILKYWDLWTQLKFDQTEPILSHFDPKPNHFAKKFLFFPRDVLGASLAGVWIGNEPGLAEREKLQTVSC